MAILTKDDNHALTNGIDTPKFGNSEKRSFFEGSELIPENKRSKTIFERNSTQYSDTSENVTGNHDSK